MRRNVFTLALAAVLAGCASAMSTARLPVRPAADAPERFMVGSLTDPLAREAPVPGAGCRNPMVDPRDGGRVTLVRSFAVDGSEHGDYRVTGGRYGVGPGELIRVDCGTGEPVGIVRS